MKNFSISVLVIFILLVISSCKKNNSNDATVDVFARSWLKNGSLAYSTVHSVVSINPMTAVTVDVPGAVSFSLSKSDGPGTSFFKDTSMEGSAPSHVPPVTGIYTYHVKFANGEQKLYTNDLTNDFLLPPVIDSLYIISDGLSLRFKWEPVEGAQSYEIRISSGQNEIFPWMELLDPSGMHTERLIAYFAYYLPGTITFELRAVKYESEEKKYVQALSYSSASIDL
jgi:hypothetical protein